MGDAGRKQQEEADGRGRDGHGLLPVLLLPPGREQRAAADAEHERAGQQAGQRGAEAQLIKAVGIDLQKDDDGQAIEEGVRAQTEEDVLSGPQSQELDSRVPCAEQGERRKLFRTGRGRAKGDEGYGAEPQHGDDQHGQSDQPAPEGDARGEPLAFKGSARQGYAQQDGERGGELEQRIGPRHLGLREDLGQGAVERRTEERRARPHAEQHGQHAAPVQGEQAPGPGQHGGHFQQLGRQHHMTLGETVRQPACPGGKEHERQRKEHRPPGLQTGEVHAHGEQQDGLLEEIVVEGAQRVAETEHHGLTGSIPLHTRTP